VGDDRHDKDQIYLKSHKHPFVLGVTPLITLIKKFASLACYYERSIQKGKIEI